MTTTSNNRSNPYLRKRNRRWRKKNKRQIALPEKRVVLKKLKTTFQRLKKITYSTSSIKRKLSNSPSINKTLSRIFPNRKLCTRHRHRSFAHVYVDDLYPHAAESPSTSAAAETTPSKVEKAVEEYYHEPVGTKNSIATGGSSGEAAGSTEREMDDDVDQRAERFIAKFYQEIRLQKQRSLEEYQDESSRQTSMAATDPSP